MFSLMCINEGTTTQLDMLSEAVEKVKSEGENRCGDRNERKNEKDAGRSVNAV